MPERWKCARCGDSHDDFPMSFHWPAPDYWVGTADAERGAGELSEDLCSVGENRFIHGLLHLPILGGDGFFTFGVWVSLSEKNWQRSVELWETEGRQNEPPYFGWLSNTLPHYPDTLNLRTKVHTRPVGERPVIELEPTNHPLAVDQRRASRSHERDRWRAACCIGRMALAGRPGPGTRPNCATNGFPRCGSS